MTSRVFTSLAHNYVISSVDKRSYNRYEHEEDDDDEEEDLYMLWELWEQNNYMKNHLGNKLHLTDDPCLSPPCSSDTASSLPDVAEPPFVRQGSAASAADPRANPRLPAAGRLTHLKYQRCYSLVTSSPSIMWIIDEVPPFQLL